MPERVLKRLDGEDAIALGAVREDVKTHDGPRMNTSKSKKRKRETSRNAVINDNATRENPSAPQKTRQVPVQTSPALQNSHSPLKSTPNKPATDHGSRKPDHNAATAPQSSPQLTQTSLRDRAKALWSTRKALPIWSHSLEIRAGLRKTDIMLLVGETGSGKSTQVPQILLNEAWCRPQFRNVASRFGTQKMKIGGCIAVTEPRRVAAISLARRVAEEVGTPLGGSSPASEVGYSVRFDHSAGPGTRIKFLTEGMLLQEILRDPCLRQYSAVVVDEVHERGVNVDLVLGFLREMVGKSEGRGGVPLKVCVMSATAEMESLKEFFEGDPGVKNATENSSEGVDGNTNGKANGSEIIDESEWSGISSSEDEDSQLAQRNDIEPTQSKTPSGASGTPLPDRSKNGLPSNHHEPNANGTSARVTTCHIEGRQYPVKINYLPEPCQDIVEASLKTIFQIHYKEPMPGDILVFLTGQETVESLESLVREYALGMGPEVPKVLVLPLFAALPQAAQQRVFQPAPTKTRKVIISTNIAETSVTVSGVRFVIDCGKAKIKHFRSRIGLESLLVKPISKSAAIQRKGRAGREAPGQCYRLYTEKDYLTLQQSNTPEILRCDLSHPILTMKAHGVEDVINFPFLDQPPHEAMQKALLQLWMLNALTETGKISDIGSQIARFPLSVALGRALIAAAEPEADCIAEVVDIISCLSVENVFLSLHSEEKKEQAEAARQELYKREGDHLTLLATVQAYAAEGSDRKAWADRHFVSHRAMRSVMDVRKQLRGQCEQNGTLPKSVDDMSASRTVSAETGAAILRSFLKGFAMNTAVLCPDGSYKTFVGKQIVAIHPSSVLFGRKVEAIMFNEFVFTKKSYARGVSAVQLDWIGERFPAG